VSVGCGGARSRARGYVPGVFAGSLKRCSDGDRAQQRFRRSSPAPASARRPPPELVRGRVRLQLVDAALPQRPRALEVQRRPRHLVALLVRLKVRARREAATPDGVPLASELLPGAPRLGEPPTEVDVALVRHGGRVRRPRRGRRGRVRRGRVRRGRVRRGRARRRRLMRRGGGGGPRRRARRWGQCGRGWCRRGPRRRRQGFVFVVVAASPRRRARQRRQRRRQRRRDRRRRGLGGVRLLVRSSLRPPSRRWSRLRGRQPPLRPPRAQRRGHRHHAHQRRRHRRPGRASPLHCVAPVRTAALTAPRRWHRVGERESARRRARPFSRGPPPLSQRRRTVRGGSSSSSSSFKRTSGGRPKRRAARGGPRAPPTRHGSAWRTPTRRTPPRRGRAPRKSVLWRATFGALR